MKLNSEFDRIQDDITQYYTEILKAAKKSQPKLVPGMPLLDENLLSPLDYWHVDYAITGITKPKTGEFGFVLSLPDYNEFLQSVPWKLYLAEVKKGANIVIFGANDASKELGFLLFNDTLPLNKIIITDVATPSRIKSNVESYFKGLEDSSIKLNFRKIVKRIEYKKVDLTNLSQISKLTHSINKEEHSTIYTLNSVISIFKPSLQDLIVKTLINNIKPKDFILFGSATICSSCTAYGSTLTTKAARTKEMIQSWFTFKYSNLQEYFNWHTNFNYHISPKSSKFVKVHKRSSSINTEFHTAPYFRYIQFTENGMTPLAICHKARINCAPTPILTPYTTGFYQK